jgi:hypothetical protein
MFCRPVVADSHHFDEEQVPDPEPHRSEKLDPDPHHLIADPVFKSTLRGNLLLRISTGFLVFKRVEVPLLYRSVQELLP